MKTLTQKPQSNIKLQITSSIDELTDSQQNQIMKENQTNAFDKPNTKIA